MRSVTELFSMLAGLDLAIENGGQLRGQFGIVRQFRIVRAALRPQGIGQIERGLPTGFVVAPQGAHEGVAVIAFLGQPIEHHPDHHHHDHDDARHDEQLQDKARAGRLDRRQSVIRGKVPGRGRIVGHGWNSRRG